MFTPSTPLALTSLTVCATVASPCCRPAHMPGVLRLKSCSTTVTTTFVPCWRAVGTSAAEARRRDPCVAFASNGGGVCGDAYGRESGRRDGLEDSAPCPPRRPPMLVAESHLPFASWTEPAPTENHRPWLSAIG